MIKKKLQSLALQTHVKIYSFIIVFGMLTLYVGCRLSETGNLHPIVWIGFLITMLGVSWCISFVKCPYCGSGLYYIRQIPNYCPDCGKKLN